MKKHNTLSKKVLSLLLVVVMAFGGMAVFADEDDPPMPKEDTPTASVDFINEVLTGFQPGGLYLISNANKDADGSGNIPIENTWFGQTVSIIKKSITDDKIDSDSQELDIPQRPAAPNVSTTNATGGNNNGTITGVNSSMEYRNSNNNEWIPISGTIATSLATGTYQVRLQATSSSFAGTAATVTVGSQSATYTVTIIGGGTGSYGSGNYAPGATVTIYAGNSNNFSSWSVTSGGVTLSNYYNRTTTFTMPANNVTITANWSGSGTGGSYHVSISGSNASTTGEGYYNPGDTVYIYAGSRSYYSFNGWTISSQSGGTVSISNSKNPSAYFTMPSYNVHLVANWVDSNYYYGNNNSGSGGSGNNNNYNYNYPSNTNNNNNNRDDRTPTPTPVPAPPRNDNNESDFKTSLAPVTPSLLLNEWSPAIDGVTPYVMVQVDTNTKIGAVSPRVFTDFIKGSVDFVDGVAVLRGLNKTSGEVTEVRMTANSTTATINGQSYDIATYSGSAEPGMVSVHVSASNNFYVPLRFMTNAFGYTIDWNPVTATATIKQ